MNKTSKAVELTQADEVNHPTRYNHSKYECIDIIDDLNLNFNLGSCVKYIWRCGWKNSEINELEKARWYLDHEIQRRKEQMKNKVEEKA